MTIAQIAQPSKTDRPSVLPVHAPACPAPDVSRGDNAPARPPVPQRGPRPEHYRRIPLNGTETTADLRARGVPARTARTAVKRGWYTQQYHHPQLSLSRLNHRLPGCKAHLEMVQGTPYFHHQSADALLPQADPVCAETTALDPAVDMVAPQPARGERLMGSCRLPGQLLAAGWRGRHPDRPLGQRARQEAQILPQPAPRGPGRRRRGGQALLVDTAAGRRPQHEHRAEGLDPQDLVSRLVLCRAALPRRLVRRVLGAAAAPCRPVMGHRGAAGAAAGTGTTGPGSSSSGTTPGAAAASETPRRGARAVRARGGASPRGRRAARSAGKRTCLH